MNHRTALFASVCVSTATFVATCFAPAAQAQTAPLREKLQANAVASFQQGRFPEAYGRFVALANAGHAPAAEVALFMAQHSAAVFGKDWDVTQEELTTWAALTGRPAPQLQVRSYLRGGVPVATASR